MKKFPLSLSVTREQDGTDTFYIAHTDGVQSIDVDGEPVAIYDLRVTGRAKVSRTFTISPDQTKKDE